MELIKITNVEGKETVNARELYDFLGVQSKFSDWIRNRIDKFDFQENQDFTTLSKNLENGGRQIEYHITIEMAKELSMVENNEKGQQARRYFIECEKRLKAVFQIPQTYSEALRLAADQAETIEKQAKQIEDNRPKVEFFEAVAESKTAIDMRKAAAVLDIKGLGRNNLFELLREKEILDGANIPYRKYQDQGYFRVIESKWTDAKGETKISFKTVVYQKGLNFIKKLIDKENK